MTEALQVEATGETVGEAKWAALRALERRHPGLDKAAVQFEVVAEGKRGILGVGYEPARVVAHLPSDAAEAAAAAEPATEEGGQAEERKAIVVDAAGYRERRKASLDALAVRSAERAVSTGQRVELEPMTAVERKVVHLRLKDYPGVTTASEGTEPNRFVVIAPGG